MARDLNAAPATEGGKSGKNCLLGAGARRNPVTQESTLSTGRASCKIGGAALIASSLGIDQAIYNEPRMIGVQIRYTFGPNR